MRTLRLKSLAINGFKSYSTPVVIDFTTEPGLRFLTGDNQVDAKLGQNGCGKSSTWDALYWCCYGISTRKARASTLINPAADKITVSVVWEIDGDDHTITREAPPDRLMVNGVREEQTTVDEILGLTADRFLASVLFGQGVPLFYDLSIPDRGALLDSVLDLGYWLELSEYVSRKLKKLDTDLREAERELSFARGGLAHFDAARLAELEQARDTWTAAHEAEVKATIATVEMAEINVTRARAGVGHAAETQGSPFDEAELAQQIASQQKELIRLSTQKITASERIKTINIQSAFYEEGYAKCPTCGQPISEESAHAACTLLSNDLIQATADQEEARQAEALLRPALQANQDRLANMRAIQRTAERLQQVAQDELIRCQTRLDEATAAAERLIDEVNPFVDQVTRFYADHAAAEQLVTSRQAAVTDIRQATDRLDYWRNGFKLVRLFLIRRTLEALTVEVSSAAGTLGLLGWRLEFTTETETKSGTTKQGVQITVTAPEHNAAREFSPGELQRVRLATAMGLGSLIQRMAGVEYGIEIWDEPSNFLSGNGIDDLLDNLDYRAAHKVVWLVDHRALNFGFYEVWSAVKTTEGTSVNLLTSAGG